MEPKSYSFKRHKGKNVQIIGTFLYSPENCIILNLESKKEFMLEYNKDFIHSLREGEIENYSFNDDTIYISDVCVLYGHVRKLNYSYILELHHFHKFNNVA